MLIGVHGHQFPPQREEILRQMGIRIWTLLNMDWGYYKRFVRPTDTVVLRIYDPDCMGHPPEQWADRCHREMVQIVADGGGDPNRFILQCANELKLGVEHNNHGWEVWDDQAHADQILEWWRRVLVALNGFPRSYRIGAPAESPGHNDTDGYNDVRRYAAAGIYDLIDVYLAHFYAQGVDQQGFDDPQRIYYADRVLTLRKQLDETHPHLPIIVSECNRKDIKIGDVLGEFDRYCGRIAGAVAGITWFVWSSGDASFGTFQLSEIPDQMPRFQSIIDKYAGATPQPPDPEPPQPEPPLPIDPNIATIEARYNMSHKDGQQFVLARLTERPDPNNVTAVGPAGVELLVETDDHQNQVRGIGRADMAFNHDAAYVPSKGQHGFFSSYCGDAEVHGQGWPLIEGDTASHRNVVAEFARRTTPPPQPEPPPSGHTWQGAFADFAAAHPEVGRPVGPIAYLPQNTEPWPIAAQLSASHVLLWDGAQTVAIKRAA